MICSADGCDQDVKVRGWCHKHYFRWRARGTVDHWCSGCNQGLPEDSFATPRAKLCVACAELRRQRERTRLREHQRTEAGRAYQRAWRKTDKGRATERRYTQSQKFKVVLRRYHDTPAGRAKLKRAWNKRRQRIGDATLTAADWAAIVETFGGRCAYCANALGTTQDHVIPLSKSGQHVASNVVPACAPCNLSKGNRGVDVWMERRGYDLAAFRAKCAKHDIACN